MGIARKFLTEDRRREIASGLFEVDQSRSKGDELHGLCPIHGEKNPSFSYNPAKDQYHCFSCGASGDLVRLWAEVNGRAADRRDAFWGFCEAYGIDPREGHRSRNKTAQEERRRPSKAPDPIIPESKWERLPALPPEYARRLEKERGWFEGTILGLDLRLFRHPKSGEERIAIPIRNDEGALVNVRLYLPGASQNKVLSWGKGYGRSRLFPPAAYWPQDPVWLCEGEPGTLAALSRGLSAVTLTTGAGTWKREFEAAFRGRDVVIVYDADQKGQDGADKVGRALAGAARLVRIIEWPDFMGRQEDGLWPADHGQDLTDFFLRYGRSVGDLKALLASARTVAAPNPSDDAMGPARFFVLGANGRGRSFKSNLLAREILDENELITDPLTGLTYRWNGAFWEELLVRHIRRMALQKLGTEGTKARSEDAAAQVADLALLGPGEALNPHPNLICLQNGTLNLEDLSVWPHRKDHFITF